MTEPDTSSNDPQQLDEWVGAVKANCLGIITKQTATLHGGHGAAVSDRLHFTDGTVWTSIGEEECEQREIESRTILDECISLDKSVEESKKAWMDSTQSPGPRGLLV